jgi:hypothetical protein
MIAVEFPKGRNQQDETETTGPDPVCDDDPYPCYQPGIYEARCVRARVYLHPRLRAWKCELKYALIPSSEVVFGFFHLGDGDKPVPTRGSEYRRAWIVASGEQPKKRQKLSKGMFVGKIFDVRIDYTTRTWDQREHVAAERYSTVKEILRRRWP